MDAWTAIVIISRNCSDGSRWVAAAEGEVIAASLSRQIETIVQIIVIAALMLIISLSLFIVFPFSQILTLVVRLRSRLVWNRYIVKNRSASAFKVALTR